METVDAVASVAEGMMMLSKVLVKIFDTELLNS